jgi:hypothetical protein
MKYFKSKLPSEIDCDKKIWLLSSFLFLTLGIIFLIFSNLIVESGEWFLHELFCILSTLIILAKFFLFIQKKKERFVDFRYIFLFMYWLYYIFGSLFIVYGDPQIVDQRSTANYADIKMVLKINAINSIGLAIVLFVASVTKQLWPFKFINSIILEIKNLNISAEKFFLILSFLSLSIFILVFLYDTGYSNLRILPGIVRNFKDLLLVCILIGTLYVGKNQKFYISLSIIFSFLFFLSGIFLFSKTQLVIGFAVLIFGYSIRKNSIFPICISLIGLYLLLSSFGNLFQYARINYNEDFKKILPKVSIFKKSLIEDKESEDNIFNLWNRISYVNTQAAAVELYDSGDGGEDYKLIPWVFVPRIIYKDKPNISSIGSNFYQKISGNIGSSDSPGIFVDSYYNLGWIGLISGALIAGFIIAIYSSVGSIILRNNLYPLFFLILFGLITSVRIDGRIIDDFLGLFVIIIYINFIIYFFFRIINLKNKLK